MQGISSKAANSLENKKKYNGIEFDNDLEINTYEAFFRELDPQIARWWQIDPKTDGYENLSPYASMYDDPIKYSDLLGDEGEDCCKWLKKLAASASGAILGTIDNNIPFSNLTGNIAKSGIIEDPDVAAAWNGGVTASNVMGMVQGSGEATGGAGLASGSGAVTVATAGLSSEITIPVAAVGIGMAVHGTFVYGKSQANLTSGNGLINIPDRVNSTSNNSPSKDKSTTPSVEQQAQTLSKKLGKNSVVINTPGKLIRFDLVGKPHGGVPTPHVQTYIKNFLNGVQRNISRESKKATPLTQEQMRIITNFLRRK